MNLIVTLHNRCRDVFYIIINTLTLPDLLSLSVLDSATHAVMEQPSIWWYLWRRDLTRFYIPSGAGITFKLDYLRHARKYEYARRSAEQYINTRGQTNYYNALINYATQYGLERIIEREPFSPNYNYEVGTAAYLGYHHLIDTFVAQGASLNRQENNPLARALESGNVDLAAYLFSRGSTTIYWPVDIISTAARHGHVQVLRFLRRYGLDLAPHGQLIFEVARTHSREGVIKFLKDEMKISLDPTVETLLDAGELSE